MSLALAFSLAAAVCYAWLVVLVARRGLRLRVEQTFALYLVMMLAWQTTYIVVCLSPTEGLALLAYRFMAAAAVGQGIIIFYFSRALLRIRWRRLGRVGGAAIWVAALLLALASDLCFPSVRRDEVTHLFVPEFGPLIVLMGLCTFTFLGCGLANLIRGYRRAGSDLERNRLRYLLIATTIVPLGAMANFLPGLTGYPVDVTINIASALLLSYAILRYQLLDITLVVRRGLAYSILTVGIAVTYLLSVLLFERLVRASGLGAYLLPVILALVAAILLQPWRDKAQAWVDRLLFREKYDSRLMLQRLSRQAATIIDLETLAGLLLNEVCEKMHIERAALLLKGGGEGLVVAATRGTDPEVMGLGLGDDHPIVQWLQHSDHLLRARDLEMLPQFRSLWSQEREDLSRLGAELFIPLQVKNALVGILAVGPKLSGEAHSLDDEITLSTLANQAAVAVENAHLFATTKARVAELTVLQEIGVQLVSSRYLSTVLQVVVESCLRLLAADEAHVLLYDARRDRFLTGHGLSAGGEAVTLSWGAAAAIPLQLVVRSGKTVVIGDLWLHAAIPPALARQGRIRAVAAYPLRREEAIIAVLAAAYYRPRTIAEDELRLLGMLADQATLAINNAQLLESEQEKRQLADTLREVSRVIGSTLQLDELLDLVLEQLQNVLSYDIAAVMLATGDRLEVNAGRGLEVVKRFLGTSLSLSEHAFLRQIVQERRPVAMRDILDDTRSGQIPEGLPLRSVLGVPLIVRDELRGILAAGNAKPGFYGEEDLQNALAFANQAALAIENARLYQRTTVEQRKTETILEETFSGIVVADVNLRIVTFNPGAEAITGLVAQDVIGRRVPEALGPDIVAPGSPLGQVMARREPVPPQETVIQAASGLRDILLGAAALRDAQQRLYGYLLSFADITRLKEVERLKTDIVANVSHELRTPLASIKAYTELLLDDFDGSDRQVRDQFLQIIDAETDRLAQLISDLLDLSRLEAGRFEVRKVTLDVQEVLGNVLSALDVQLRNRQIAVRAVVPADLPALQADRDMFTIVVRNLLANAAKFSPLGGEVCIAFNNSMDCLAIEVTDHGIGIPAEAMPHLFQKFYRSPMATEMGIEGTGLGLVLTKQAVEAHGGTVEVVSDPGVRTTFTVRLPWG